MAQKCGRVGGWLGDGESRGYCAVGSSDVVFGDTSAWLHLTEDTCCHVRHRRPTELVGWDLLNT